MRIISVSNNKGGVGKTTSTINIAAALQICGKRVLIIDIDHQAQATYHLGINPKEIEHSVFEVLKGEIAWQDVLVDRKGIHVLPAKNDLKDLDFLPFPAKEFLLKEALEDLKDYDYILIDCPAGIERGFHRSVGAAVEAIVVVTPNISSIRDADKVIQLLKTYELAQIYLIINRVRGDLIVRGENLPVSEVVDLLKIPLIGVIPEDDEVSIYAGLGKFIKENSITQKALNILARNLDKETDEVYDCTQKYRGLLGGIRRNLKKRI
ncbi:MAG: AAA family ATPase [Firmicutes bacterium]|nr:AAA family ATPase [Bacillota bacterium]